MADYGSHLTVLATVLDREKPKRVLEFGAGDHSTPMFLSRPIDLLVSVEPDSDWRDRIRQANPDPRHHILAGGDFDPQDFDLVFIDNGVSGALPFGAERCRTIRQVLSVPHPTVIVHDVETDVYAEAIDECAINYQVFPTAPDTAVISATNK